MTARCRVKFWDTTGSGRGRGNLLAVVDDAKNIGGSDYANDAGEFFMTLPYNHPAVSEIDPLTSHYEVSRWDGSAYQPIFAGLVEDFDATENEVVYYGSDYMGLLRGTITSATTSYTSTAISTIIISQLFTNPVGSATTETESRLGFMTQGTINSTATTTTVISAYEQRLNFLQSVIRILQSNGTTRPQLYVPRAAPTTFEFDSNRGANQLSVRLEWGGNVNGFRWRPYGPDFATRINALGVKREGAAVLYSTQTYASESTYGWIARPALFQDVVNQTALDNLALRDARRYGKVGQGVSMRVKVHGLAPWDGYDLMDSLPVYISRGPVSVAGDLFTLWGLQWRLKPTGEEELILDLLPKDT